MILGSGEELESIDELLRGEELETAIQDVIVVKWASGLIERPTEHSHIH